MSAIAGMNPLQNVQSVVRQQPQHIPITTNSPPPFLLQGHRRPSSSSPPGLQSLPHLDSPPRTEQHSDKKPGTEGQHQIVSQHQTAGLGQHQTVSLSQHQTISLSQHQTVSLSQHQTIGLGQHQTVGLGQHQNVGQHQTVGQHQHVGLHLNPVNHQLVSTTLHLQPSVHQSGGHQLQADSHHLQAGGHQLQSGGHQLQTGGHQLQSDGHQILAGGHQAGGHQLQPGGHQLQADDHQIESQLHDHLNSRTAERANSHERALSSSPQRHLSTDQDQDQDPESDDELFINEEEGPSLDDDDDSSLHETPGGDFDDNSTFVDEGDTTYGSPGLREAFAEGYNGGAMDEDSNNVMDNNIRAGSADNSRRNKRKNFRPRNINNVYSINDDSDNDSPGGTDGESPSALNLTSGLDYRRSLLPHSADRENSPMDLSVPPRPDLESDSEGEEEGSQTALESKPKLGGLSLVRPEILFGENKVPSSSASDSSSAYEPSPLSLLANLPGMANTPLNPFLSKLGTADAAAANTMRDAFKEVLKMYGVSSDIAESIVQNTSPDQRQEKPAGGDLSNPFPLSNAMHPGMLSAALQGNPPPQHPPTPPRTPHLLKNPEDLKMHGLPPKMPSLLSSAFIQQHMKPGMPPALPAHINKMGLQGLPPGMLGVHPLAGLPPGAGLPPMPSHLLAAQRVGLIPGRPSHQTDYTRYFKRFGSSLECGSVHCKDMNYREHFHCSVPMCKGKDFAKKEEMIRHSKWHQKMDEALKYGFRRVTPMDDCADQFQGCSHNKKQTHYHCIQSEGCDKVYISTSDVQMHYNYHRKDNAIQREGFLRFRGAEDCQASHCLYRGQRTTHFHCNRSSCQFTFKNKADMEKHKNYHMKDEQLNKDGFKKFMKQEPCGFSNCKFSRTHNHIHCIRPHCEYVLHSSGQLFSHKRKHERKDNELAYRKYKLAQSMMQSIGGPVPAPPNLSFPFSGSGPPSAGSVNLALSDSGDRPPSANGSFTSDSSTPPPTSQSQFSSKFPVSFAQNSPHVTTSMSMSQPLPPSSNFNGHDLPRRDQPAMSLSNSHPSMLIIPEDVWQNYLLKFDAEEGCGFQGCDVEDTEHFHCKDEGCETVFRSEEGVQEHGKCHYQQDHVSDLYFIKSDPEDGPSSCPMHCPYRNKEMHYHCKWEQCTEIITLTDIPFRRLDHYKIHEYTKKWNTAQKEPISMTMTTNIDAMFKRKRGRPPKNRVIEVFEKNFGGSNSMGGTPQAVFTSFKLPKPGPPMPSDFPGLPGPGLVNSPYSFSVASLRPPLTQFTTTTQFNIKPEPGHEMTPQGHAAILANPGITDSQDAKKERPDSPIAEVEPVVKKSHDNSLSEHGSSGEDQTPPKNMGLIKARGTYYPLTAFPTSMPQGPVMRKNGSPPPPENPLQAEETSPPISMKSKIGVNFMVSVGRNGDTGDNALAKLLQASQDLGFAEPGSMESHFNKQQHLTTDEHKPDRLSQPSPLSRQSDLSSVRGSPSPRMTPSSIPSPRLAPSPISLPTSPVVSSPHMVSSSLPLSLATSNPFGMSARAPPFLPSSPGMLPPGINPFFPHAGIMIPGVPNPFQRFPGDPRLTTGLFDPSKPFPRPGWPGSQERLQMNQKRASPIELDDDIGLTLDQKKMRLQTSMRMLKDEPVPEGYMRFRFNEDCQFSNCNYREHQTHFHCMRKDCNYRFCDKTRFVQHTARHERLDTLCGDEFQGFRGVPCGREECELNVQHNASANQKSSSHFHCLKCDYFCTDTNKVVAHRRQHQKLDSIMAAGFEKFTPTQFCATPGCSHNGKQTHYHCRKCQYAVLGLSQMEAHKYRHINDG